MKKLLAFILILSLLIATVSCSKNTNPDEPPATTNPTHSDDDDPNALKKREPLSANRGEPLRVLICPTYQDNIDDGGLVDNDKNAREPAMEALEYLNTVLLPSEGFNIEFVIGPENRVLRPDNDFMGNNFWKMLTADPAKLFEFFDQGYVLLGDFQALSQLQLDFALSFAVEAQDLSIYADLAPSIFIDRYIRDNRIIPVKNDVGEASLVWPPNQLGYVNIEQYNSGEIVALIKSDVYNEYRQDAGNIITSIDEYEEFLDWALENKPNMIPLLSFPLHHHEYATWRQDPQIFNLFLPKYGYEPLWHHFLPFDRIGDCLFIDMSSGKLCQLNEIPKTILTDVVTDAKRWQDKYRLLRKEDDYKRFESSDNIASFLTTASKVRLGKTILPAWNWPDPPWKQIKIVPSKYHIATLYSGLMPKNDVGTYIHHAMAKEGVDLSDFFLFLEWMHRDLDFYTKMMYGIEGVDYEWSDNKTMLLPLDTNYNFNNWIIYPRYKDGYDLLDPTYIYHVNPFQMRFSIASMESRLREKSLPANYNEVMNSMKYKDIPGFRDILIRAESVEVHDEDLKRSERLYIQAIYPAYANAYSVLEDIASGTATTEELVERLLRPTRLGEVIELLAGE